MKKIVMFLMMLISCMAFGVVTETSSIESKTETLESEAYAHADLVVTANGRRAVVVQPLSPFEKKRIVFDNLNTYTAMNQQTETLDAFYGWIDRIYIDVNGTDSNTFCVTLRDENAYTIYVQTDVNQGAFSVSNSVPLAARDSNQSVFPYPIAGAMTIEVNQVDQQAEVQTVSVEPNGTAGTFTLTLDGDTTTALDVNAPDVDIQTALVALDGLSSGDVNVATSGGVGFADDDANLTLTFLATVGNVNALTITITDMNSATGSTVTEVTEGGNTLTMLEVILYLRKFWP